MGDEIDRLIRLKSQCLRRTQIYLRDLKVNAEIGNSRDSREDAENPLYENIDINSDLRHSRQDEPSSSKNSSKGSKIFHEDFQNCGDLILELKETEIEYMKTLKENIDAYKLMVTFHESREILEEADMFKAFMDKLLSLQANLSSHLSEVRSLSEVLELFIKGVGLLLILTYKDFFMNDEKYHSLKIEIGTHQDPNRKEIRMAAVIFKRLVHYKEIFDSVSKKVSSTDNISEEVKTCLFNITTVLQQCNKKLVLEKIVLSPLVNSNAAGSVKDAARTLMIDYCPLDPDNKYGNYFMQNSFIINEPFKEYVTLYLFSNVILITVKQGESHHRYRSHLDLIDHITLGPESRNKKILVLEDRPRGLTFTFEAEFEQIQTDWRSKIHEILCEQMEAAKLRLKSRRQATE